MQLLPIVDILFKSIQKKLAERGVELSLTQKAKEYIAEAGFDPVYGATTSKESSI